MHELEDRIAHLRRVIEEGGFEVTASESSAASSFLLIFAEKPAAGVASLKTDHHPERAVAAV